jgi:hypothetical protein
MACIGKLRIAGFSDARRMPIIATGLPGRLGGRAPNLDNPQQRLQPSSIGIPGRAAAVARFWHQPCMTELSDLQILRRQQ